MNARKPPSGRDIWNAVREELTANLYTLPFSRVAPTVYHVYLHPDDFDTIEGIVPRIVDEISKAVAKEIGRLNAETSRRGRLRGMLRKPPDDPAIEAPEKLEIFIQADQDGELQPGTLGIVSRLMVPAPREFVGPATVRTVKTIVADGRRTSTLVDPSGGTRATLAYKDDVGDQLVPILKDLVKVGRGGSGAWADVQVFSTQKVSREHCWIIRESNGRFFIRDVSVWGTSVNGQPLPPAVRSGEGTVSEPGAQAELPPNARIQLADALVIDFRVEAQP
ncbi:MAG TPA: FhaA domain-containing protein [Vicinamibacterales bacterium]|nr:FhaA domain-containing protein [Vicinamibacterales bacterium]